MISIMNVSYKKIINYPNIDINNKTTFICGRSGSGKTTLLRLMNNTISPEKGVIYYKDKNIDEYDVIELRKKIILVTQDVFLFEGTIRENFKKFYEYRNEKIGDEEIKKYLEICVIDFDLDSLCTNMSGGERQRIYIAICLSFKPEVILLDEPTSALDEKTANKLMENIIKIEDLNIVVVSHDKENAKKYAEEIICLGEKNE